MLLNYIILLVDHVVGWIGYFDLSPGKEEQTSLISPFRPDIVSLIVRSTISENITCIISSRWIKALDMCNSSCSCIRLV